MVFDYRQTVRQLDSRTVGQSARSQAFFQFSNLVPQATSKPEQHESQIGSRGACLAIPL